MKFVNALARMTLVFLAGVIAGATFIVAKAENTAEAATAVQTYADRK